MRNFNINRKKSNSLEKHILLDGCQKPVQSKIKAIQEMPAPQSKKAGTVIYWHG